MPIGRLASTQRTGVSRKHVGEGSNRNGLSLNPVSVKDVANGRGVSEIRETRGMQTARTGTVIHVARR